jgi:phospholipase D1/2
MSPEIFLKRPTDDLQYRLDKILLKKAKEGVKIYILLYKEITFALNLMSLRTRQLLSEYGLNPNIKVLRHPDHFFDGVFLWSHHEKCVIVDQSIALMGGIGN